MYANSVVSQELILKEAGMTAIGRVLFDQAHQNAWAITAQGASGINPQNPKDAGFTDAANAINALGYEVSALTEGTFTDEVLQGVGVVVLLHSSAPEWEKTNGVGTATFTREEQDALERFVRRGGGLVIFGETEFPKYQNSAFDMASRFGVKIENATVQDTINNFRDVATWITAEAKSQAKFDLFARVSQICLYRSGYLTLEKNGDFHHTFAQTYESASPALAAVVIGVEAGNGRAIVVADSDVFGDDSIHDLDNLEFWTNLLLWVSPKSVTDNVVSSFKAIETASWLELVDAIETIRPMQNKDGSVDLETFTKADVEKQVTRITASIRDLIAFFPHQKAQLEQTIVDFETWVTEGCHVPDFYKSLDLFRPEQNREDGVKNLSVFPMYTQNGNPSRNFEAVITNTYWPDWLAEQEQTKYNNPAFVPIEFVGFTKGYDTHSAVLFPETVAIKGSMQFTWGGIFCDREAARFRKISESATSLLKLALPPDAELLLANQKLAQDTFVLWDLIHDRSHSHGDLPFDPFMIKQRMPFWMYALEELRCDLNTYRETLLLDSEGVYLGRFIRIAILFDRLLRFPITGDRTRNYDGLAGQIIFAHLHKKGVLRWTDNTLSINWDEVTDAIVELCEQVESLYREGIDRSRIAHWLAAYEFVSGLVEAHPASTWAKGVEALPVQGELKELVNAVLPDEFPLNVFYEALRTKLAPTIADVVGITG